MIEQEIQKLVEIETLRDEIETAEAIEAVDRELAMRARFAAVSAAVLKGNYR